MKRTNFIKLIRLWGTIFLIGIGVSIIVIDVASSYRDFKSRADQMRKDYIVRQKQIIKQEVNRVVDLVNYEREQGEILTKSKIKSRVYEAYSIAQNIYQQNKTSKSRDEIQKMILDALRPIRFEHGTGYYFITRLDGVEMLFADKPEMEGLNLLGMQDTRGQYIIKDTIKIARQSGEGFYEYHWTKPDSTGNEFKKISFIKRFEPYDWFIGAGLYVDDVESQIKSHLLSNVSRIRFGKEGYIFIDRLNGDALVSNGKLFSGTKKLWEVFNKNPEKMKNIFRKEYNAALKPEGDYIYYSHIKLTAPNIESPKVSFILGIPDFQWLVGAGVYLDDVETDIASMQAKLNNHLKETVLYFILTVMGIIALFYLFFNWLSRGLKNDFMHIVSFFDKAAYSDEEIDLKAIKFVELDQMAKYSNKMITDRKQAVVDLRESEQCLRDLFDNMSSGVAVYEAVNNGSDFIFKDFNKAGEKIEDVKKEDVMGKSVISIFPELKNFGLFDVFQRVWKTGNPEHFPTAFYQDARIGGWRDYYVYKLSSGEIVSVYTDETERKLAEEALQESEKKYRNLFENLYDVYYRTDDKGIFTLLSPSVERQFGFKPEELIGKNIKDIYVHSERREEGLSILTKNGYVDNFEAQLKRKDNSVAWASTNAKLLKDKEGNITGVEGITRDITYAKKLEEQIRQSQKMESIGTLAGGIAHDFNNIIGIILGNIELALDDVPEWHSSRLHLNEIQTAGFRAKDVVRQLLSFARKTQIEKQPINIIHIVKESLNLLRSSIPTSIEIRRNIPENIDTILTDPTQINQILINLCTNAYHAVSNGGIIEVTLRNIEINKNTASQYPELYPGRYVNLTVSDTGCGIPKKNVGRIFDPYYTTKEVGKGTGMGLAVVHGIVKEHSGFIKIKSDLGKGTTFSIFFPVIEREAMIEEDTKEKLPTGSEMILFIDDEEALIKMGRQRLERLGYKVEATTNPIEALELFRCQPDKFDLVISDLTMPKMTGEKLAREILIIRPGIPIILCTGYNEKIDEKKAKMSGAADYIEKPYDKHDFAFKVRKVLERK